MKNRKTTRKALGLSAISLLLCLAMLAGTTFAWFTDSVTSGRNQIVAGNLDIELEYATDDDLTEWKSVADEDAENLFDEAALWEPGHTEVVYLRVINKGTLALKYRLGINILEERPGTNVYGEEFNLSDYLVFKQIDLGDDETALSRYESREDVWAAEGMEKDLTGDTEATDSEESEDPVLLPGEAKFVAVAVYMPTTVGNEANYRNPDDFPKDEAEGIALLAEVTPDYVPYIELGVSVQAAQTPYEEDSFDENYDENATYDEDAEEEPEPEPTPEPEPEEHELLSVTDIQNLLTAEATKTTVTEIIFGNWKDYSSEVGGDFEAGKAIVEGDDSARVFYTNNGKSVYFLTKGDKDTFIAPESVKNLFNGYSAVTKIVFSALDTSDVTNMSNLFNGCKELTTLDISNLDTAKVTDMTDMFKNCAKLTSFNFENFDTSSVKNMYEMFYGCVGLTSLDLRDFDTQSLENVGFMFNGCTNLASIDLSNFNTEKITNMASMFNGCSALTSLDLSSFDTKNVTNMANMFQNCTSLVTIYATDKFVTTKVSSYNNMFKDCTSIKGGADTGYVSNQVGKTYARIDQGTSKPGYFTQAPAN